MSLMFRSILIAVSVGTFCYMVRKIRKSQMQISDAVFWIGFSMILVVLSAFPHAAVFLSGLLQMATTVNFVFLMVIFLLLLQLFLLSIKVSRLESRLNELAGEMALANYRKYEEE